MTLNHSTDTIFIQKLTKIVEANLSNENFGVNELVDKMGLSRSQVHRRLKKVTNKSVSQFIREIRLEKAKELLEDGSLTSSEIAYKVGFGSPSYFIKSFHDYFGYPPGETKNQNQSMQKPEEKIQSQSIKTRLFKKRQKLIIVITTIIVLVFAYFIYNLFPVEEKSIVVIPLKNLGSDENTQAFADGISIEIRNQLAKIPGLKVITGPTADQLRESKLLSPEIARKVNAKYILSGSLQQQNNDVHINIELSDARQDRILWSGKYDRDDADIFTVYIDIAKNVADNLQTILSTEEIKQIEKSYPKNFEAYNNYMLGQYFCLKRDSLSIQKGIGYFNKAIEIDSNYILAYAGLADGYYALSFTGNIERSSGYDMAYKMAETALEKDSTLAGAYAVLGVVSKFGYWKWEEARKFFEKALAVDSNCMVAHLYYCSFLDIVGEPGKALYHANKAIELEPYLRIPYNMKGIIYRNEKKYMESTDAFRKSLIIYPEREGIYSHIFLNFINLKDEESAIQTLKELFSIKGKYQKYINEVTPVYKKSGMNGVLKLYIEAELAVNKNSLPAEFYAKLGMQNEALDCLERRCREREADVPRIIRKPELESLHSHPRFQALVDTMNLRPYFPKPSK